MRKSQDLSDVLFTVKIKSLKLVLASFELEQKSLHETHFKICRTET